MSQQIMTIVRMLEEILAEAGDMGDTEYMAKKAFDGKLVTITGEINNLTDSIEFIVPSDKRFYFHSAKITQKLHTDPGGSDNATEADLLIDSIVVDTANVGMMSSFITQGTSGKSGAAYSLKSDSFDVKGFSLIGDGIKKIEIVNVLSTGTTTGASATIIGFNEDTLTDPTLLAQSITVEATVAGETGDLAFLTEKVLAGDYFQVSGDINALNDTIEFIPAAGKTAFLIEAKITMSTNPFIVVNTSFNNINEQVVADLLIDSVRKSKAKIGMNQSFRNESVAGEGAGMGMGVNSESKFNVLGLSLVGDGVKKIEIENVLDNGSAFAEMSGYLIDT